MRTAAPLKFMYVCGLASTTPSPASVPTPTCDFDSGRVTRIAARSAMASTARKPMLCGVQSYCEPGLPRPTITLIASQIRPPFPAGRLLLLLGLLGLGRSFGGFAFALFFLLALLHHFGFGRCGIGGDGGIGDRLFFHL